MVFEATLGDLYAERRGCMLSYVRREEQLKRLTLGPDQSADYTTPSEPCPELPENVSARRLRVWM